MSASIPTLELSRLDDDPTGFATELGDAFGRWGFAAFTAHGLPDTVIEDAYAAIKAVFALPADQKRAYHVEGIAGQRGYTPFGIEHAKDSDLADLKEFWSVGRELPADHELASAYPPNVWPEEIASFRPRLLDMFAGLEKVAHRVLRGVAIHLGLPEDYFARHCAIGNHVLRPLHYPPIDGPTDAVRSGRHEDINCITLLVGSGEPGLQILTADGDWLDVPMLEGTLVCNVGDMLQRLTNHRLISTTHRVVNPPAPWSERSRYSIPFFTHFNADYLIETLPQCVDAEHPDRNPEPITADAFLNQRLRAIGLG